MSPYAALLQVLRFEASCQPHLLGASGTRSPCLFLYVVGSAAEC